MTRQQRCVPITKPPEKNCRSHQSRLTLGDNDFMLTLRVHPKEGPFLGTSENNPSTGILFSHSRLYPGPSQKTRGEQNLDGHTGGTVTPLGPFLCIPLGATGVLFGKEYKESIRGIIFRVVVIGLSVMTRLCQKQTTQYTRSPAASGPQLRMTRSSTGDMEWKYTREGLSSRSSH